MMLNKVCISALLSVFVYIGLFAVGTNFLQILVILGIAVSLILLLNCTRLAPFSQAVTFKVALLTPVTISDVGWNALAYDGLKAVEKELPVKKVNHIESKTPAQWEEHFFFFFRIRIRR